MAEAKEIEAALEESRTGCVRALGDWTRNSPLANSLVASTHAVAYRAMTQGLARAVLQLRAVPLAPGESFDRAVSIRDAVQLPPQQPPSELIVLGASVPPLARQLGSLLHMRLGSALHARGRSAHSLAFALDVVPMVRVICSLERRRTMDPVRCYGNGRPEVVRNAIDAAEAATAALLAARARPPPPLTRRAMAAAAAAAAAAEAEAEAADALKELHTIPLPSPQLPPFKHYFEDELAPALIHAMELYGGFSSMRLI